MTPLAPALLPLGLLFLIAVLSGFVGTVLNKDNRAKLRSNSLWISVIFAGLAAGLSFFSGETLAARVWLISMGFLIASIVMIARAKEKIMQAIRRS